MKTNLMNQFHWNNIDNKSYEALSDTEKYQMLVSWAAEARGRNPKAFDELTEWILDDSEWCEDKLPENEQILIHGVFERFKQQNAQLRKYLKELEPSGVVNAAVFPALDRFNSELSGKTYAEELKETVSEVFSDFSAMKDGSIRRLFAGDKTGPEGVNSVDVFGYINYLKDCDARIQWALFMPALVERQQENFKVESFEYRRMPAMRFVGFEGEEYVDLGKRMDKMKAIYALAEYKTELDFDVFFMHHYGLCVDVGEWHGFWGRFMKADTPVPDGFVSFDFLPYNDGKSGLPYISQFSFATYSGDMEELHKNNDAAMYEITRNIMLGQDVNIPYPDKYWTAEVFLNGFENYSTAYMFSAEF